MVFSILDHSLWFKDRIFQSLSPLIVSTGDEVVLTLDEILLCEHSNTKNF